MVIVNDRQCQYFLCITFTDFDGVLIANLIFSGRRQRPEGAEDSDLQALRRDQPDRFGNAKNTSCVHHAEQVRIWQTRRGSSKQNKRPAIGRQSSTRPSTCKSTLLFFLTIT